MATTSSGTSTGRRTSWRHCSARSAIATRPAPGVTPKRQAIFVGDFIDRGPAQVRSVAHRPPHGRCRCRARRHGQSRTERHRVAHTRSQAPGSVFLRSHVSAEMGRQEPETARRLPGRSGGQAGVARRDHRLVLDPPALAGVCPTCWWCMRAGIRRSWHGWRRICTMSRYLTRDLMVLATDEPENETEKDDGTPSIFKAVECLTKGIEVPLPAGHYFRDKDGITRRPRQGALVGRKRHDLPHRCDAVPSGMRGTARSSDPRACANRADGQASVLRALLAHWHAVSAIEASRVCRLQRRQRRSPRRVSLRRRARALP